MTNEPSHHLHGRRAPRRIQVRGESRMPNCKLYGGITRAELDHLRSDLAKEGVMVPAGDEVSFAGQYGVELRVTYDEAKETLRVCITKRPFYIPESMIWGIVDAGVEPYEGT
ncbi:MAG: hypothetical protein ACRD9R_09175 [Pyrinomonadaceae bacterium]